MANTIFQLRRSNTSGTPGTALAAGELAYSYNTTIQALYIGSNAGVGTAANLIAGTKYNWLQQANTGTPGAQAANATVITDGNNFVYNVFSQGLIIAPTVTGAVGNSTVAFINSISNTGNSTQLGANATGGGMGTEFATTAAITAYVIAKAGGSSVSGSNTQIQFNNSAAFGSNAALTYAFDTTTLSVGNSTAGTFKISTGTSNVTANVTAITFANATSNSIITPSSYFTGNSIANVVLNQTTLTLANATANTILTPVSAFHGNSIANSFVNSIAIILANATSNIVMSPLNISYGNSVAYANVTQTTVGVVNSISNVTVTPASITVANSTQNTIVTPASFFVGNSIANSVLNSTTLTIANATANSVLTPVNHSFGNSTLYSNVTSASITVVNATGTATLTPLTVAVGNSTINVNFTGGIFDVRATNTNITSNVTITSANIDATSAFLRVQQASISGNLSVQGNLSVTGTLTSIDTTNIVVKDPVIIVNDQGTTTDTADIGLVGYFGNSTVTQIAGLIRKNGGAGAGYANTFMLVTSQTAYTNTGTTIAVDANLQLGTLQSWLYSSSNSTTTGLLSVNSTGATLTANSTWAVGITANTLSLTTALPVGSGGSGVASVPLGAILLGNTTSAMVATTIGANGTILQILNSAGATSQAVVGYGGIDGGTF